MNKLRGVAGNPKNQHYLPESYLQNFSADGKGLWVYDIEKDEIRGQAIRDTGSKNYYYCFTGQDGKRNFELEKRFAEIEGAAKSILRDKLEKQVPIDAADKAALSHYIALQKVRTPDFQSDVEHWTESLLRKMLRMQSTPEQIQKFLDEEEKRTGRKSTTTAEKIAAFVKKDTYTVAIRREHSLQAMLQILPETIAWINSYEWAVIFSGDDDPFVTTDSPFLIRPPHDWPKNSFYSGIGMGIKGATKFMPLSARICLMMHDPGPKMSYKQANPQAVRYINCWLTDRAYRFVVGPTKELVAGLVTEVKAMKTQSGNPWGGSKLEINGLLPAKKK